MKVRVKESLQEHFIGFIDHARRRPGDVFVISDQPRRPLNTGEIRLLEQEPENKVVYEQIKDDAGHIPRDFSFRWMEQVNPRTPEKVSTSPEAMSQRSETIKQERAGQRALDAGDDIGGAGDAAAGDAAEVI